MKMKWLVLSILLSTLFAANSSAQRYLSEVFSDYSVTSDVVYATNLTVITGMPDSEDLLMDVYEPVGDTETSRPVILLAHDGEYLPVPLNRLPYGYKNDSAVVVLAGSLAKRGFVVVTYTYRLGWNPTSFDQDVRTGTLINAYYRSIQDGFTLVRYLKMDADVQGNNFGIDPSKIVSGGMGTGGSLSLGMAFLDKAAEMQLPKFFNVSAQPYVDTSLLGNVYGTQVKPLNLANHPTYDNEIQMTFNLGGHVGDSTWIEPGDIPVVSMASPSDPFSPFGFGAQITRVTGDFVTNVSGSEQVQEKQHEFGNNLSFSSVVNADPYTAQADLMNNGLDGLYPFHRATPEDSPWHFWDFATWDIAHPNGGTFNTQTMLTNPDMSATKGYTYIDTIVNYLSPRMVCVLNLPGCANASLQENISQTDFALYPNPTQGIFKLESKTDIEFITITDVRGNKVYEQDETSKQVLEINLSHVKSGVYFVRIVTSGEAIQKRVVVSRK